MIQYEGGINKAKYSAKVEHTGLLTGRGAHGRSLQCKF